MKIQKIFSNHKYLGIIRNALESCGEWEIARADDVLFRSPSVRLAAARRSNACRGILATRRPKP